MALFTEDEQDGLLAVEAIVNSKTTPVKEKKKLLEKEIRSGKQDVFKGFKQLKNALQGGHSLDIMATQSREANRRVNKGRAKIVFAKTQLIKLTRGSTKSKKYWK